MNLNVGCGDHPIDGWVNVDIRSGDLIADATHLPFPNGIFDRVAAFDLLEHFPRQRITSVLAEWRRVLASHGKLTIKVPNLSRLAALIDSPGMTNAIVENIYGGHRWGPDGAYDSHHWGWTPHTIDRELRDAGYTPYGNDEALNMTVEAARA